MPFTIENKEFRVIKINFVDPLLFEDFQKLLELITRIFKKKQPFAFYVHCNFKSNVSPIQSAQVTKYLLDWLRSSESDIINYLQGTAVIFKSESVSDLLKGVFALKAPKKPMLITTEYDKGKNFVTDIMKRSYSLSTRSDSYLGS